MVLKFPLSTDQVKSPDWCILHLRPMHAFSRHMFWFCSKGVTWYISSGGNNSVGGGRNASSACETLDGVFNSDAHNASADGRLEFLTDTDLFLNQTLVVRPNYKREVPQIGNVDVSVNVDVESHPVGSFTPQILKFTPAN